MTMTMEMVGLEQKSEQAVNELAMEVDKWTGKNRAWDALGEFVVVESRTRRQSGETVYWYEVLRLERWEACTCPPEENDGEVHGRILGVTATGEMRVRHDTSGPGAYASWTTNCHYRAESFRDVIAMLADGLVRVRPDWMRCSVDGCELEPMYLLCEAGTPLLCGGHQAEQRRDGWKLDGEPVGRF